MRTGCAVFVEGKEQFLGQVLEFVSGDGLDKILRRTEVSIFLLRQMLFEVTSKASFVLQDHRDYTLMRYIPLFGLSA